MSCWCKSRWGTRDFNSSFARSGFGFVLYRVLKNLVASVEIQSLEIEVFSGRGFVVSVLSASVPGHSHCLGKY